MQEAKDDTEKDDQKIDFNSLKEHFGDFIKSKLEYYKLTLIEYIAKIAAPAVFILVFIFMFLIFWIFLNIAIAVAIGQALTNLWLGFLLIAAFNLLIILVVSLLYKVLIFKPVTNWLVRTLSKAFTKDEDK